MKLKKILAVWLACLLLSGCIGETPVESPVSTPQEPTQTVVLPESEQTEQSPEEEPSVSTVPTETPEEPDVVTSVSRLAHSVCRHRESHPKSQRDISLLA